MKFTKMHGCGNDYVYVNCFEEKIENPSETARLVSDRHFGIGSDGLILICPSVSYTHLSPSGVVWLTPFIIFVTSYKPI